MPLLFSHSVLPDSLWPHGLQQVSLPRLSPSPGDCSNACPLSRWCHPATSSSVVPFSSCLQSFPESALCCAVLSHSVVSDSLWLHGLQPTRLLSPWGFSRQEYWSVLPCPPSGDLPNPGIKPRSLVLQVDSLTSETPRKPSSIRVFSIESALLIRYPEYWSFSFSVTPSNEYSVLISFRIDWFDLLAVQGTLKSLLQPHGSKASILWCPAFLMVQFSHPYMTTTRKTVPLTIWIFIGKVMSLLFNMLSSFIIAFLPRSKSLLISWPQSPSAVILEPKKIESVTVSIVSTSICHYVIGLDAMILVFWMLNFKPTFSLFSFTFFKRLSSSSLLSAIRWCHRISEVIDICPGNLDSSLCFIQPSILHDALCILKARLKAGREGNDRGWDGLMASPIQWILVWAGSGSW